MCPSKMGFAVKAHRSFSLTVKAPNAKLQKDCLVMEGAGTLKFFLHSCCLAAIVSTTCLKGISQGDEHLLSHCRWKMH